MTGAPDPILPLLDTYGIRQRRMTVNGMELDVLESGPDDGPLVVLSHGFPELAWSWRHQLKALGEAGWHAIAPDQRGYGRSTRPTDVPDYASDHLGADLLGLVDQIAGPGAPAVFVGHDWGAFVVWDLARTQPSRVRALVNLSVPFIDWPAPPTDLFKMLYTDKWFYILYFQPVGVAEADMDQQIDPIIRGLIFGGSGEGFRSEIPEPLPMAGTDFMTGFRLSAQPPHPAWLSEADVQVYLDRFHHSGFFGPVSWYRNLDRNHARVSAFPVSAMTMPAWFIGGTKDGVIARDANFETRNQLVPGYRGMTMIEGAGHWTQQERPDEVNAALLGYLSQV
jgi:pimeloyl-ACP methyl ester carboxylesterase